MTAVALGFFVALMIGLTGVGGGVLTVPLLILFLGTRPAEAVGTALAFSAVVKLPACYVYLRKKSVDFRVLRTMVLGGLPGVALGSVLLGDLARSDRRHLVLIVVGATIALTAGAHLARLLRGSLRQPSDRSDRSFLLPWLTLPIGIEVGFSSAGAGALGTLILLQLTTLGPSQVVGTDLFFGLLLSFVGGGIHIGLGDWSTALFLTLIGGGIPGALLGARLANVLPARWLRAVLLVWLIYVGAHLLIRGFSGGIP